MTHLHLASNRKEVERPSNWDLAIRIVKDVLRMEPHAYFLWSNGRWEHATVDDIMRRANMRQKSFNRPQFSGKREWIVE
jgi:hypothetical protein